MALWCRGLHIRLMPQRSLVWSREETQIPLKLCQVECKSLQITHPELPAVLLWIRELLKSSLPHSHVALRYGNDTSVMQNLIPSCILHFVSWPDIKVNHFSWNMQSILFSHVMRCPVRSYGVIYEKCSQLLNHLCSHGLISSPSRGLHEARFGA